MVKQVGSVVLIWNIFMYGSKFFLSHLIIFNFLSTWPTLITAGSDNCFHTCCWSVPSVPTFQNLAKQSKLQVKTMFTTSETVGMAEWIIDDTCLV